MSDTRVPPATAVANHIIQTIVTSSTGIAYTLVTHTLPPYHPGLPLHQHPAHTETCTITQGMLALTYDGCTVMLAQGESVIIPPGVTHTYWNPTAATTILTLRYEPDSKANEVTLLAQGVASDLVIFVDTNTTD